MNDQLKISLRLNLSDFIGTLYESDVINIITKIYDTLQRPFKLYLWYENDEDISHKELKRFMSEYEDKLQYKTIITVGTYKNPNEFAWFDIISIKDLLKSGCQRFQYVYNSGKDILSGLQEFKKCAEFCTSPKPTKQRKQKRNDYEDK